MLYLVGGFAVLCGLLMLGYAFVNADPARLARGLKIAGIVLAVIAVAALAVVGRIGILLLPLSLAMPLLVRLRSRLGAFRATSASGRSSTVASDFVRMTLDHDTGAMTGTVLTGQFAGMRLDELGPVELLALLRECRAADEEGARLVEAYLDRTHPDWRDELRGGHADGRRSPAGGEMSVEEAYAVLGLTPGAGAAEIRAAHRRLMTKLHPDHGGSDYIATQINRARDVLLGR